MFSYYLEQHQLREAGGFFGGIISSEEGAPIFSWIYDCGEGKPHFSVKLTSTKEPRLLPQRINSFLKRTNRRIDIVFISHWDNDHVNGLPMLLKSSSIGHIVSPYVEHPFQRIAVFIRSISREAFLKYDEESLHALVGIMLAEEVGSTINSGPYRDSKLQRTPLNIHTFSPQVTKNKSIARDVQNVLNAYKVPMGATQNTVSKLRSIASNQSLWRDFKRKISQACGGAKNINEASLCIYMSSDSESFPNWFISGDANFKKLMYLNQLFSWFSPFSLQTQIAMLPHHGSSNNYSNNYLTHLKLPTTTYVSVSSRKNRKHPSSQVLVDAQSLTGSAPIVVCDGGSSLVRAGRF